MRVMLPVRQEWGLMMVHTSGLGNLFNRISFFAVCKVHKFFLLSGISRLLTPCHERYCLEEMKKRAQKGVATCDQCTKPDFLNCRTA